MGINPLNTQILPGAYQRATNSNHHLETSDPSPSTKYVTPLSKNAAPKYKKGEKACTYTETLEKDSLMELEMNRNMKKAAAKRIKKRG